MYFKPRHNNYVLVFVSLNDQFFYHSAANSQKRKNIYPFLPGLSDQNDSPISVMYQCLSLHYWYCWRPHNN